MKISQLTADITDNPNFIKWFENSVVTDDSNNPLIVYHGTNESFDTFNGMVWASTDHSLSADYAEMRSSLNTGSAASVIPLYMKILHPFNADFMPRTVTVSDMFNAMLEQAGFGSTIPTNMQNPIRHNWDIVESGRKTEESGPYYGRHSFWNEASSSFGRHSFWNEASSSFGQQGAAAIKASFILLGFDGVKMIEANNITYGAFNPSQVKSVFNKQFNSSSSNISEGNIYASNT